MLAAAMKSVKVFIFIICRVVVPGLAHFAAAADVRDGEDHAAVEQREAAERKLAGMEMPWEP